jgi:hypothetical protein
MTSEGDKRYLSLDIGLQGPIVRQIHDFAKKPVERLVDPLHGNILRVKVPFRYRRVMCCVSGDKTIQELVKGDVVNAELKFCGWWSSGEYGGPSWKVDAIRWVRPESGDTVSDS